MHNDDYRGFGLTSLSHLRRPVSNEGLGYKISIANISDDIGCLAL